MREHAISHRQRREQGEVQPQRPARRRSATGSSRPIVRFLLLFAKFVLASIPVVLVFAAYKAAASASFFNLKSVDINTTTRANADDIRSVVKSNVESAGVWRVDLTMLGTEIKKLPWVKDAVVSRILPDGMRIRIIERAPLAVVRTSKGKFVWVDVDAVTLGPTSPADNLPHFFIRGWDESATPEGESDNTERLQKYLEMTTEWDRLGIATRVSEVNLVDLRDVRAQLSGSDSQIEVRLGGRDFGKRLNNALDVLDSKRDTDRGPLITRLDATVEGRVIVGLATVTSASQINERQTGGADNAASSNRQNSTTTSQEMTSRRSSGPKKEDPKKRETEKRNANSEVRPRRVSER